MAGLRIMNELLDPVTREGAISSHIFTAADDGGVPLKHALSARPSTGSGRAVEGPDATCEGEGTSSTRTWDPASAGLREGLPLSTRSSRVHTDVPIPATPCLDRRVREIPDLREVWSYINPFMLYGRHLGFKGRFEQRLAARDLKALELFERVEAAKEDAATFMRVRAVWQFFEAERDGNAIHLFEPGAPAPLQTFRFGRQPVPDGVCLSDYVIDDGKGRRDHVGLFVVTAGEGVRHRADAAKHRGEFVLSHILQALALETAEGAAEWVHRRMREEWGFPDPQTMTMAQRWTAQYRGRRYSFGYPACPNLDDQQGIWRLLNPDDIGVQLTEGFMMDPEASVSALVFHHPDCVYFGVEQAQN
jgi:5-methyltetrahydrofolate--homocysteine methyltransferase